MATTPRKTEPRAASTAAASTPKATAMSPTVAELSQVLLDAGTTAPNLTAYRNRALEVLRPVVNYDAALFHALSPRVPLATAALYGIDLALLASSQKSWDDLAVELGAVRERANHHRVASLESVFTPGSKTHTSLVKRLRALFGMSSLCIVHLVVRQQVGSAIVFLAKRAGAFDVATLELLHTLAPVLALGDRLHEALDGAPRAASPVQLRCLDERLTERQREIVERVALGHSNEQIASGLGLSANTVRNHLARVFARIGSSNRADLVRLAVLQPRGLSQEHVRPETEAVRGPRNKATLDGHSRARDD